ncbi:MAG: sulfite exporter TauE/SafE family protein [Actinobacteria bacterium]|nr:sulfite exporter TauE/SafE family protein [Actinomycetota bacterium]
MDAGIFRDALTLVAGVATGLMSGTFGVGGAVISTPAIRALGCSAALAVGTTLPSILPGAVTGSWRYRQGELIRWQVIRFTAPSGIVAAVVGAWVSPRVPGNGHLLMVLTALLLMWRGGGNQKISELSCNSYWSICWWIVWIARTRWRNHHGSAVSTLAQTAN